MTGSSHVEIEARLLVCGPRRAELFERIERNTEVGGLRVAPFERVQIEDMYFDADAGTLAAIDCALRIRRQQRGGRESTLLTFKGRATSGASHCVERLELEAPFSSRILADVMEELRARGVSLADRVPQALDGRAALEELGFSPLQLRRTNRALALLYNGDDPVAELTLDEVHYTLGDVCVLHREVELEACGTATAAQVLLLAEQLAGRYAADLTPWRWSKTALGRALESLQHAGHLEQLLEGEQLTAEGYARVERALGTS